MGFVDHALVIRLSRAKAFQTVGFLLIVWSLTLTPWGYGGFPRSYPLVESPWQVGTVGKRISYEWYIRLQTGIDRYQRLTAMADLHLSLHCFSGQLRLGACSFVGFRPGGPDPVSADHLSLCGSKNEASRRIPRFTNSLGAMEKEKKESNKQHSN